MGYPNRDNRGGRGGGRDFGGGQRFRPAEMHKAVCSTCGNECEVPFKPSGDKPVYCRDCFAKNRSHEGGSFGRDNKDNRDNPRGDFKRFNEERPTPTPKNHDLDAINSKLDQILELLNNRTETPKVEAEKNPPTPKATKGQGKRVSKKVVSVPEETPTE